MILSSLHGIPATVVFRLIAQSQPKAAFAGCSLAQCRRSRHLVKQNGSPRRPRSSTSSEVGFIITCCFSAAYPNSRFDCPLAGKNRPPVKRGDSLKMKLQWLEVQTLPNNVFLLEIFLSYQFAPTICSKLSWYQSGRVATHPEDCNSILEKG